MNIKIRLMEPSEVSEVNAVYNRAYGNIRPDSNFIWEFINGPSGKAIYVIAEDLDRKEEKIIGTQCAIPIEMINADDKSFLTAKSEDTFVHPEYRGQKLFERMYDLLFEECKKAGIKYIWGFTYARKPFLKIGFEIPFETLQGLFVRNTYKSYRYLSLLNPENKFKDKIKIGGLVVAAAAKRIFSSRKESGSIDHVSIGREKQKFISGILKTGGAKFSIKQNDDYLKWRIDNNPYRNNYIQFSDEKSYFITFNIRQEGFVYLEELLFVGVNSIDQKIRILNSAISSVAKRNNFSCIRFWGFDKNSYNNSEIDLLKKSGFVFVKKGTAFVWKDINNLSEKINVDKVLMSRIYTQGNR